MRQTIRVGVLDDEEPERAVLVRHLRRYEAEHAVRLDVSTFATGPELLDRYGADLDIVFLDVQMPGDDGFEVARRLRDLDTDLVIVFVTHMGHLAIRGYEVEALGYLVKPVPYFAFSRELGRAVRRSRRVVPDALMLSLPDGVARVGIGDVVYVESTGHRITVHALDRRYELRGTLKAFESELADKGFHRSNNCYLVNLRHVVAVRATSCVLRGDVELQVSRPRRRAFLDALAQHVGGGPP